MQIVIFDRTEDYKNYSEYELRVRKGNTIKAWYSIIKDDEHLYFGEYVTSLYFLGNKHFPRTVKRDSFTLKKGKFYGDIPGNSEALKAIFSTCGIDWIRDIVKEHGYLRYLTNKVIFKQILSGKISGEQDFFQKIAKIVYHNPNLHWKTLREYVKYYTVPIPDLMSFTVDVNKSMEVINKNNNAYLINDILEYAFKLDQKVDLTWSERRLRDFHQQQINEVQKIESVTKDTTPILSKEVIESLETPIVKVLNTEQEYFLNGATMNNCTYGCYWKRFKNKEYLILLIHTSEGDINVGIDLTKPTKVHQVYLSHNRDVNQDTRRFVDLYMLTHKKELEKLKWDKGERVGNGIADFRQQIINNN